MEQKEAHVRSFSRGEVGAVNRNSADVRFPARSGVERAEMSDEGTNFSHRQSPQFSETVACENCGVCRHQAEPGPKLPCAKSRKGLLF